MGQLMDVSSRTFSRVSRIASPDAPRLLFRDADGSVMVGVEPVELTEPLCLELGTADLAVLVGVEPLEDFRPRHHLRLGRAGLEFGERELTVVIGVKLGKLRFDVLGDPDAAVSAATRCCAALASAVLMKPSLFVSTRANAAFRSATTWVRVILAGACVAAGAASRRSAVATINCFVTFVLRSF